MKKTIGLVLPTIRPYKMDKIINCLREQSVRPDQVLIVDNSCSFDDFDVKLMHEGFRVICLGKNIGCNASWNFMWEMDTDYVGAVADDLILNPLLFEAFINALDMEFNEKKNGAVTASQCYSARIPPTNLHNITGKHVRAKGRCGAFLMKKCTINCIPPIPECFFNYFGDNYFEYWFSILDLNFIEINSHIIHELHSNKKSEIKEFKGETISELGHWKDYIRGKGKYTP